MLRGEWGPGVPEVTCGVSALLTSRTLQCACAMLRGWTRLEVQLAEEKGKVSNGQRELKDPQALLNQAQANIAKLLQDRQLEHARQKRSRIEGVQLGRGERTEEFNQLQKRCVSATSLLCCVHVLYRHNAISGCVSSE